MANPEHLKFILQGILAFYQLQQVDPDASKDINKLFDIFEQAIVNWNKWRRRKFREPDLSNADLHGPNSSGLFLQEADLSSTNFSNSNLSRALLRKADVSHSNLSGANLSDAFLADANFSSANLSNASLRNAKLMNTNFMGANLRGTDFTDAELGWTMFLSTDLSEAKGLDTLVYAGPGFLDIETIYSSIGKAPAIFFDLCGIPNEFMTYAQSLIQAGHVIQFYSCFISYSHNDEEFAKRLYSRMRASNLRVWYAPEEVKGGEKLYEQIDRAIQFHDRVLLVLSERSMKSEWVMTEIRRARKAEREGNRRKLFPIRLVDFNVIQNWECFDADSGKDLAIELREYFIPDFSNWKDHNAFEKAFDRLLRDLKAEEK